MATRVKKVVKYNESDEDDNEEEEEVKSEDEDSEDNNKKQKKKKNEVKKENKNKKQIESESESESEAEFEDDSEESKSESNEDDDEDDEEEFEDESESDDERKSKKRKSISKNKTTNKKTETKANKTKSTKTTKTVQRKSKKQSDEDDDDDEDDSEDDSPKKKRARKTPTKKTTTKSTTTKSTKGKSKASPKPRRKSKHNSDEDDDDDDNNNDDDDDNDGDSNDDGDDSDDEDDDDNNDDDGDDGENNGRSKRSSSKKKSSSSSSNKKPRKTSDRISLKSLTRLERIDEARKAYKWWEAENLPHGVNWRKLEHPGIVFPPSYVRHNIPLLYDGKPVALTTEQEEIATFYAAIPDDGPQLGNPKTRPVFQENFFNDFKNSLPPGHVIKKFDKCDFSRIREHLNLQKSLKKAATDEEKQSVKKEKESLVLRYGYALIDGRIEKMGNYNMEPPGLFRGRGEHPKTGLVKQRCYPESVDLNLSVDSCVPRCHLPGHSWQSIRHDPLVTWLCGWNENVQQSHKYVMLAASSSFKGKSDLEKYDKAIRLATHITKIRKDYTSKIKSKDALSKQLGTAMWVIDNLALRVGGEKGEDEADTVGCCSLRVEHVTFIKSKKSTEPSYELELEFLGKDSMLYKQTINFATYGDLGKLVFENIKSFCSGKESTDEIFEQLTPPILNRHLNSLMKGLTAKVFRTFNASITLEKELPTAEDLEGLSIQEKIIRYNAANREVAILCNHQKTVSKAAEVMFENLNEKLETLRQQRTELLAWRELLQKGKESKIPLKEDDTEVIDGIVEQLRAAQVLRDTAKTTEEKLEAANEMEAAKLAQKNDQKRRFQEKHMYKSIPSENSLESKISRWQEDIRKLETDIRNRDENKEVALGTSKINYMDPRISVAWCKRCEVPIDKVFAKTLRDKFNWAMAVPPDWKFTPQTS